MEILGIGLPELLFILLIALILLGPKDMIQAGRTVGKALRGIVTSPAWKALRVTGKELQQLPTRLMREAGLEDELQDIGKEMRDVSRLSRSFDEKRVPNTILPSPAPPSMEQAPGPESSPDDPQT